MAKTINKYYRKPRKTYIQSLDSKQMVTKMLSKKVTRLAKRIPKVEEKFYGNSDTSIGFSGAGSAIVATWQLSQGASHQNRIGNRIFVKYIEFTIAADLLNSRAIRMHVSQNVTGSAAIDTDLIPLSTSALSPVYFVGRNNLIYDEVFHKDANLDTIVAGRGEHFVIKKRIYINKVWSYDDGVTAPITSCPGNIQVSLIGTAVAVDPALVSLMICYTDD